jgi:hypothetical protein
VQLCKDFENDYGEVNKQLDKMGYNIGLRLIEDYLAKSNTMKRCSNFRETADMIARVWIRFASNRYFPGTNICYKGRIQDISKHHTANYELDK